MRSVKGLAWLLSALLALLLSHSALAAKPAGVGGAQGAHGSTAMEQERDREGDGAKQKEKQKEKQKGNGDEPRGLEKQREMKMEQERKEEGKGSEQGQTRREEHSRKWWRFWE